MSQTICLKPESSDLEASDHAMCLSRESLSTITLVIQMTTWNDLDDIMMHDTLQLLQHQ